MRPEDIYKLFGFYDSKWCVSVKGGTRVRCVHPKPSTLDEIETPYSETMVTLHAWAEHGQRVGIAGKCEVCGKVYHVDP